MTNPVGQLLRIDDVALDLELASGAALLQRLAPMLVRSLRPTQAEVLASLMAREQLGSTAVGHGIAIPHARVRECVAPAAAFLRTRIGIPFNAPDTKPVSIFLGLIVPKESNQQHLKLLATAATMFSDREFRDRLRMSSDPASVLDLFQAWPNSSSLSSEREKPME